MATDVSALKTIGGIAYKLQDLLCHGCSFGGAGYVVQQLFAKLLSDVAGNVHGMYCNQPSAKSKPAVEKKKYSGKSELDMRGEHSII